MRVQYYILFSNWTEGLFCLFLFKGSFLFLSFLFLLAQKLHVWSLSLTVDAKSLNYKGNSSNLGTEPAPWAVFWIQFFLSVPWFFFFPCQYLIHVFSTQHLALDAWPGIGSALVCESKRAWEHSTLTDSSDCREQSRERCTVQIVILNH